MAGKVGDEIIHQFENFAPLKFGNGHFVMDVITNP